MSPCQALLGLSEGFLFKSEEVKYVFNFYCKLHLVCFSYILITWIDRAQYTACFNLYYKTKQSLKN